MSFCMRKMNNKLVIKVDLFHYKINFEYISNDKSKKCAQK